MGTSASRSPHSPDVRIKESALKMTIRVTIDKLSTGKARRAAFTPEKPLFFVYNPSTATQWARNALKSAESGPYGPVFAIFRTFIRTIGLTGRKTAKISNKGLQPTTHKLSAMHNELLATHQSGIVRGSQLNPDVGIKESALKMSTRVTIDKLSTGKARRTALPLKNPMFFVYNPSTATKRAENARKTDKNGLYGNASAISRTFFRTMDLTGRKTAKISNNRFQATTHKLSHCDGLRTLQSFIVGHGLLHTAVGRA